MSKVFTRILGYFSNRDMVGMDKVGNRYFARSGVIDGVSKAKWDPTSKGVFTVKSYYLKLLIFAHSSKISLSKILKEKRWVKFKGEEEDPTSIPVEWICWLNGQRKKAPTPEEMAEFEARREFVRENVERLKKEEEQRRAIQGNVHKIAGASKAGGPDLQSFLQQVPRSEGESEGASETGGDMSKAEETDRAEIPPHQEPPESRTTEPTGSGVTFRPGTWQPPS